MMRKTIFTSLLALAACGDSGGDTPGDDGVTPDAPNPSGGETIRLNDDVITNTTFLAKNTYVIPRLKQVFVKSGATLTIEPGTLIKGEQGGVLVITRGSKIDAVGTADKPITFTSAQPEGSRTPGFWGGVLVLGSAPINVNTLSVPPSTEATFEAFTSAIPEGKFGGTNPHDNSGRMKYVRIEFGGFNFVADREFNNLTLCGVGDATEIDYIQVHKGADDGVELFGGTVNVKHLLSSQNEDDGFDTDNGWEGKAQFVIVQNISHPPTLPEASNGYESDNHGTAASYTAEPRTIPTLYNVTLIGDHEYTGTKSYAAVLRRGTGGHYFNQLFINFPQGIELRDQETKDQLDAGKLEIRNSILFGNDTAGTNYPPPQPAPALDIDEKAYLETAWQNRVGVDPGMPPTMLSKASPSFVPPAGSAALTGGATPPNDGFFDPTATFVGAVGTTDWTAGWAKYPQN